MAYWFMDDGGKLGSKNKNIVLNTQSISDKKVEIMASDLDDKFNLGCQTRWNNGKKVTVVTNYDIFIS